MDDCIRALIEYFQKELPHLKSSYKWKIPSIEGFERSGEYGYEPNVALKKFLNIHWSHSSTEDRYPLAKTIVADWGGVKGNHQATLNGYVHQLESVTPATPIKGIASYSKIFAISDMNRYAIYDARVACSLNAIQWNSGVKQGIAFNYISGRNNVTEHVGKKIGFAFHDTFKIRSLIQVGWQGIKNDET